MLGVGSIQNDAQNLRKFDSCRSSIGECGRGRGFRGRDRKRKRRGRRLGQVRSALHALWLLVVKRDGSFFLFLSYLGILSTRLLDPSAFIVPLSSDLRLFFPFKPTREPANDPVAHAPEPKRHQTNTLESKPRTRLVSQYL